MGWNHVNRNTLVLLVCEHDGKVFSMPSQVPLDPLLSSATILIVDDERVLCQTMTLHLERRGYQVFTAHTLEQARLTLKTKEIDLILCDWRLEGENGLDLVGEVTSGVLNSKANRHAASILFMSAHASHQVALRSIELGASDFIAKPFETSELFFRLQRIIERRALEQTVIALQTASSLEEEGRLGGLIGKSSMMKELFDLIKRVAPSHTKILLQGESGTGKEIAARTLHSLSQNPNGPFIAVNCAAIPEALVESELFGHIRGAFTHALSDRKGLIEAADGGTLFLDEIGELSLSIQAKLLRLLQEGELRRVGDHKTRKVTVRVISATLKDLQVEVAEKRFREDLFYRISVIPIELPPLRERRDDIPLLLKHLIFKHKNRLGQASIEANRSKISAEALDCLMNYAWPGNVRELENSVEYALTLSNGDRIEREDLPPTIRAMTSRKKSSLNTTSLKYYDEDGDLGLSIKKHTQVLEKSLILAALEKYDGVKTQAAKSLEISTKTLLYKLRQYKIDC